MVQITAKAPVGHTFSEASQKGPRDKFGNTAGEYKEFRESRSQMAETARSLGQAFEDLRNFSAVYDIKTRKMIANRLDKQDELYKVEYQTRLAGIKRNEQRDRQLTREADHASRQMAREQVQQARATAARHASLARSLERGAFVGGAIGDVLGGNVSSGVKTALGAGGGMLGRLIGTLLGGIPGGIFGEFAGGAIGGLAGAALTMPSEVWDASKVAGQLRLWGLAQGRAGGFGGMGLLSAFGMKNGAFGAEAPGWQKDLGLTYESAQALLASVGAVSQGSAGGAAGMMRTLGGLNMAFPKIASDLLGGIVGQGAGYGLGAGKSGAAAASYLSPWVKVLAAGQSMGLDQSKLMQSMKESLDILAKTGGPVNPAGLAALQLRLMNNGTPAGVSGAALAGMAVGFSGGFSGIRGNTLLNTALMGNPHFMADLRKPGFLEANLGGSATGRMYIQQIRAAFKQGTPQAAVSIASQALAGNWQALMPYAEEMIGPMTGGMSSLKIPMMQAMFPGVDFGTIGNYLTPNAPVNVPGGSQAYATWMSSGRAGKIKSMMDYLVKKGLGPTEAAGIVGNMMVENPWLDPHRHGGLISITAAQAGDFRKVTGVPWQQASVQQELDYAVWANRNLRYKGGTTSPGLSAAGNAGMFMANVEAPGIPHEDRRRANAEAAMMMYRDTDLKTQALQANAAQNTLFWSDTALRNLGPIANNAAHALDQVATALRNLTVGHPTNTQPHLSVGRMGRAVGLPGWAQQAVP